MAGRLYRFVGSLPAASRCGGERKRYGEVMCKQMYLSKVVDEWEAKMMVLR